MRIPVRLGIIAILFASAGAQATPAERLDEGSVRAVEGRWNEYEMTGDARSLDALLDPAYVSIATTGKISRKADIIAGAVAYAATHPGAHGSPLPMTSTVQMLGAAALVRHIGASYLSMDLFAFRNGRWRAIYSQHTAIAPVD